MLPFNNNLLDKSPVRKKTESNMPSISKWGNTVKDARQRESFSFLWLWCEAMCVLLEDMRVLEVPEVLYLNQVR